MFGRRKSTTATDRRAPETEGQRAERKSRERKSVRRDEHSTAMRPSRRHPTRVNKDVKQVDAAPEVVRPATVVEGPLWRTAAVLPVEEVPSYAVDRMNAFEEAMGRMERDAEERNTLSVGRDERLVRKLECMDERIRGVFSAFERRGERDEVAMLSQTESIEAWKQSAATAIKALRQVVAGVTADAKVVSSGIPGGNPPVSAGAVARQDVRTKKTEEAKVPASKKESSATQSAAVEQAAKQVEVAMKKNVGEGEESGALESEATGKVGGVVTAVYKAPKFLSKK